MYKNILQNANYKLEREIKIRADWEKSIEDAVVLSKKKKKKKKK